jgi:hypothetical protein
MAAVLLLLSMIANTPTTKMPTPANINASSASGPSADVRAAQNTHKAIFAGYVIILFLSAVGTCLV